MNYPDSVRFLYSLGNEIKTAKLGLDRIRTLLASLGGPERACRFVHVAGTNGKGSTCAMIEAGLRAAGLRTGLYTSPHLREPTERIRIAGEPVKSEQFAAAFDAVHGCAESLLERGAIDMHPTYFETVTAMGFWLFREMGAEIVVLEVGLGGRLDATNVVMPEVAVITPVDFDHEAFLGKSIEAIAAEKAGILKPGAPSVIARQRPEAEAVLPRQSPPWEAVGLRLHERGSEFDAVHPHTAHRVAHVACPLAGEHQVENALTAVAVLDLLGVDPAGIARTRWPGRLERASEHPEIILDGAHNPAAARALARYVERFYADRPLVLIYGAMRDKAVEEMAGILFPLFRRVIVTAAKQPRAVAPDAVLALTGHAGAESAGTVEEALTSVRASETAFVSGSLFLVAEAREALRVS